MNLNSSHKEENINSMGKPGEDCRNFPLHRGEGVGSSGHGVTSSKRNIDISSIDIGGNTE